MASGMEKMLASMLGITPESLFQQVQEMQQAVAGLFSSNRRIERKMDALLLRAGFSREQIEALNNGPGEQPAISGSRSDGQREPGAAAG